MQHVFDGRVAGQAADANSREFAQNASLRRGARGDRRVLQSLLDTTRGLVCGHSHVQARPRRPEGVFGEQGGESRVQDVRHGDGAETRLAARVLAGPRRLLRHVAGQADVRAQGQDGVPRGGDVFPRRHDAHGRMRRRDVGASPVRGVHRSMAHQEQGSGQKWSIRVPHADERRARLDRRARRHRGRGRRHLASIAWVSRLVVQR